MLVTTERLVWIDCVRSWIFRGSLQFASGFCSSPSSASPSCCSRHHCSVLCSFCLYFESQFGSGRHKIFSPPSVSTAAELRSFASAALQNVTVKNECFGGSSYVRDFSNRAAGADAR